MNTDGYNTLRLGADPPHSQQNGSYEGASIMQPKHSTRFDEGVLSAWREGLAEASKHPDLKQQVLQEQGALLPRFAEHHERLKALPRRMRRTLQRHWKQSLAGIALLLAIGQAPAATIHVNAACTLVRAIVAANVDTATLGCAKGSGADTIVLPANSTQTLTAVNNTNPFGATGLPVIRTAISIAGNNSTIRRAPAAPNFRILAVGPTGNLTLRRTTVSGGIASGRSFGKNVGGGVLSRGNLTLTNSTISGNKASGNGGGVDSNPYYLFDGFSSYTLTLTNSTISDNTTAQAGGGLYIADTSTTVTNSTISGNKALLGDGGLSDRAPLGTLILTNGAPLGTLILTNSTISGNTALGFGGGLEIRTNATVTNCTISGNTVIDSFGVSMGGGIWNSGSVALKRTLISGNTAASGSEVFNYRGGSTVGSGTVTAANFNLFGHRGGTNAQAIVGFIPGVTDITATSNGNRPTALIRILNTTLASNGGPTKTHALVAGSPAIDAVNDGTCPPPAIDQRGVKRPQDGNGDGGVACDVGSFERL